MLKSTIRNPKSAIVLPVIAISAAALAVWFLAYPHRKLDVRRARALASAGRFDMAEAMVREHLRSAKDDQEAHTLLGRLLLDNPLRKMEDPEARPVWTEALEHLGRVEPKDKPTAAIVSLYRGKALYNLSRWDEAEEAWLEALKLDPKVPEAGWALLDLYYVEVRPEETQKLALRLHAVEPDPHDRVELLVELLRQDVQSPDPESLIPLFEPCVRANPRGSHTAQALAKSLIRESKGEQGLKILNRSLELNSDDPRAWEGLLSGLDMSGHQRELDGVLQRLPTRWASDPMFAKHRGRAAQERGDLAEAIRCYREAVKHELTNLVVAYRLARALRVGGDESDADRWERLVTDANAAKAEVAGLYQQANAIKTLGTTPHPDLYRRIGDVRARMLRRDEARAWYRLALLVRPGDSEILLALRKLDESVGGQ
jgi:tetratricopeptide (TPR) repeat protein